jgi:hypothetical protein
MSCCFNKSQILGNISEHPYVTIEYIYNLIDGPGCVSIVQNGCLVVKEELWLKTPYHVVQLLHHTSAAFWVNHIPAAGCLTYSSGMKV